MILLTKKFLSIIYCISRIYIKCWTFWRKTWVSYLKYFGNFSLRKTWWLEWIAGPVSGHPLAVNVLTGPKHCRSLRESTFIILFFTLKWIEIENVVPSQICIPRTPSLPIVFWCQVSFPYYRKFIVTNSMHLS